MGGNYIVLPFPSIEECKSLGRMNNCALLWEESDEPVNRDEARK